MSEDWGRCVLFESIGLPQLLCKVLAESVAGALVKTIVEILIFNGETCTKRQHTLSAIQSLKYHVTVSYLL